MSLPHLARGVFRACFWWFLANPLGSGPFSRRSPRRSPRGSADTPTPAANWLGGAALPSRHRRWSAVLIGGLLLACRSGRSGWSASQGPAWAGLLRPSDLPHGWLGREDGPHAGDDDKAVNQPVGHGNASPHSTEGLAAWADSENIACPIGQVVPSAQGEASPRCEVGLGDEWLTRLQHLRSVPSCGKPSEISCKLASFGDWQAVPC